MAGLKSLGIKRKNSNRKSLSTFLKRIYQLVYKKDCFTNLNSSNFNCVLVLKCVSFTMLILLLGSTIKD